MDASSSYEDAKQDLSAVKRPGNNKSSDMSLAMDSESQEGSNISAMLLNAKNNPLAGTGKANRAPQLIIENEDQTIEFEDQKPDLSAVKRPVREDSAPSMMPESSSEAGSGISMLLMKK